MLRQAVSANVSGRDAHGPPTGHQQLFGNHLGIGYDAYNFFCGQKMVKAVGKDLLVSELIPVFIKLSNDEQVQSITCTSFSN